MAMFLNLYIKGKMSSKINVKISIVGDEVVVW